MRSVWKEWTVLESLLVSATMPTKSPTATKQQNGWCELGVGILHYKYVTILPNLDICAVHGWHSGHQMYVKLCQLNNRLVDACITFGSECCFTGHYIHVKLPSKLDRQYFLVVVTSGDAEADRSSFVSWQPHYRADWIPTRLNREGDYLTEN